MKEKLITLFLKLVAWAGDNIVIKEETLIDFIRKCDYNSDDYISISEFITALKDFLKRRII